MVKLKKELRRLAIDLEVAKALRLKGHTSQEQYKLSVEEVADKLLKLAEEVGNEDTGQKA